ncbi:MAG: MgtC/SapB family protein [bacterium]
MSVLFYKELNYLLPIILALLLGGILGWQRVHWHKPAGPRTYALVCAGATLFTILSLTAFPNDVARVASGIVTGVGFLGAGMIIRREDHVEGLTTAAGLWMSAAIGMCVGAGYYILAGLTTFLVLILFMFDVNGREAEKTVKKRISRLPPK